MTSTGFTTEKQCAKCKEVKPVGEFYTCRSYKDGLRGDCKKCGKAYAKKHREKDVDKSRAYAKEYRRKNPERVKKANAKYKLENASES